MLTPRLDAFALRYQSMTSLHLAAAVTIGSQFLLPVLVIVSRDVGVAYSVQVDLAYAAL